MKLEFQQLTIDNFAGLIGRHEIDFIKRGIGLHFVRGRNRKFPRLGANGTGKSTIFEALCWCLFGKTINGRRNPDIQPWANADGSCVTLTFAIGDRQHTLARSTKPNQLLLDDKGHDDVSLGLSFAVFGNTILQGQGRPLFFDLTPSQKMTLLSDVLELERWEIRAKAAAKTAGEMQAAIDSEKGRLDGVRQQYKEIKRLHAEAHQNFTDWSANYTTRLQTLDKQLKQLRKGARLLQGQHDDANLAYDQAMTEYEPLQRELKQLHEYLRMARDDKTRLELMRKHAVERLAGLCDELTSVQQQICPTCKQWVRGKLQEQQLDNLRHEITQCEQQRDAGSLPVANKFFEDLTQQVEQLENTETELRDKGRNARNSLDSLGPRLAELKAKIVTYGDQYNQYSNEQNPYLDQMQTLRRRQEQLRDDLVTRKKRLRLTQRKCQRIAFWGKGFRDLQLFIIEDLLQELELCSNAMLEGLGLIGWRITYAIERETKSGTIQRGLQVMIQSPDTVDAVRWECWSGGEALRLRLLGSMALSEVLLGHAGIEPNVEVYDEPAHFLSPEGVRDLVELLADRARQLQRTIFYIDHQAVESTRFASVIEVVRDKHGVQIG